MIKFDFTVSDIDAENIISCVQDRINKENQDIMSLMDKKNNLISNGTSEHSKEIIDLNYNITWLENSVIYTKSLLAQIKTYKVD